MDRTFASWEELEAHLVRWEREIGSARIHGATGEVPLVRFGRDGASRLKSIMDRPPFQRCRVLKRRLRNDGAVEVGPGRMRRAGAVYCMNQPWLTTSDWPLKGKSSSGCMIWMPALLTGTSMVPNSDMVAASPPLS